MHRISLSQMYKIEDQGYTSPCWIWLKGKSGKYGMIKVNGICIRAHIYFYILKYGKKSGVLDHLCRNTLCVNPDHLEYVMQKVNTLRGYSFAGINFRKTHCSKGHEFTEENTYKYPDGRRDCKICRKDRMKKHYLNL